MKKTLIPGLVLVLLAPAVNAAEARKPAAPAGASSAAPATEGVSVDVIGSQEAPTVFNVVPWKDRPSRVPKKQVTTSILRETLQPLDPEVLRREIELQRRLGEQ